MRLIYFMLVLDFYIIYDLLFEVSYIGVKDDAFTLKVSGLTINTKEINQSRVNVPEDRYSGSF